MIALAVPRRVLFFEIKPRALAGIAQFRGGSRSLVVSIGATFASAPDFPWSLLAIRAIDRGDAGPPTGSFRRLRRLCRSPFRASLNHSRPEYGVALVGAPSASAANMSRAIAAFAADHRRSISTRPGVM